MKKNSVTVLRLILFVVLCFFILALCRTAKPEFTVRSEKTDVIFYGEKDLWEVEYIETSKTNGMICVTYLSNFSEIERANYVEIKFNFGSLSGSSSLKRFDNTLPFKESQLKTVFQIPICISTQRIYNPIVTIEIDEQIIEVPLLSSQKAN